MYYKHNVLFAALFMLVFSLGCSSKPTLDTTAREAKMKAALETPKGKELIKEMRVTLKTILQTALEKVTGRVLDSSQLGAVDAMVEQSIEVDMFIKGIAAGEALPSSKDLAKKLTTEGLPQDVSEQFAAAILKLLTFLQTEAEKA